MPTQMRPRFSIRHLIALLAVSAGLAACSNNDPPPPPDSDTAPAPTGQAEPGNTETQAPPDLPASFVDHVPRIRLVDSYDAATGTYEYTEHDAGAVPFEMILIPGDAERGIEPFYMGKTEVTWEMFEDWMYCRDLGADPDLERSLISEGLRPTSPYGDQAVRYWVANANFPANGMSWRTAKAYCVWLSEQTGRTYRLPSDEEWLHALALGGGIPEDRARLFNEATLAENSPFDDFFGPPYGLEELLVGNVASLAPNAIGLYDFLGNAAEWVEPTEGVAWVRGGHYQLPADELVADWRGVEDQDVWNAGYPNQPVSRFWYWDHHYQGMRLVCEPVNLPEQTGEVMPPREHVSGIVHYVEPTADHAQRLRPDPMGIEREISEMPARFDMVLIPGDEENGIAPFYMQTTEVTWAMFGNWFAGHGLDDAAYEMWLSYDLHPSEYWNSDMVKMGLGDRPAVGMSRRSAELYCDWLSDQTGHTYRLPTDAEWSHALGVCGGVPLGTVSLLRRATLRENAPPIALDRDFPPVDLGARTTPARRHLPNRLGLYDLLGNAAEWVTDTGDERIVRGGHFLLSADELTTDWRAAEDTDVWRGAFPQARDDADVLRGAPFVGFRMVREVESR